MHSGSLWYLPGRDVSLQHGCKHRQWSGQTLCPRCCSRCASGSGGAVQRFGGRSAKSGPKELWKHTRTHSKHSQLSGNAVTVAALSTSYPRCSSGSGGGGSSELGDDRQNLALESCGKDTHTQSIQRQLSGTAVTDAVLSTSIHGQICPWIAFSQKLLKRSKSLEIRF